MKKITAILLLCAMVLTLAACGGGGGTAATNPPSGSEPAESYAFTMATGGTSGTYYGFCGVIANTLKDKIGDVLTITVESTGASRANIELLEDGESNIAIIQNDMMDYAYYGTTLFDASFDGMSAVMSCYPEDVQIIAKKGVDSIENLAGKTISVGAPDSGVRYNAEQILAAYGLSFDDCTIVYESFADSADSLKNGTIDAAFIVAGPPTTAVTELATNFSFDLLQIDDEHCEILAEQYGFYTKDIIPAGTYKDVDYDVQTVAVMATIVVSNDVPEDVVYAFLKGMFDYKDDITAGHGKGALIDLDTAVSGISIPFHPGAVKYFGEQGKTVE